MEDLILKTPTKIIVVGTFDEDNEISIDIYANDNRGVFSYLDESQATQLRDHLTEALEKLKKP